MNVENDKKNFQLRKMRKKGFTPLEDETSIGETLISNLGKNVSRKKKEINLRSLTGFTLIEVMVGIALFATALFPVMLMLGKSLTFGSFSHNRTIAMNEA